ncbi:MAG: YraN family protein [Candidatus Sumerlaeia bacterium]
MTVQSGKVKIRRMPPPEEKAEEPFPDIERESHLEVGRQGEKAAARYLWKKGYRIIERNYKAFRGEIDIIAEKAERLYFVEVKTRTSPHLAEPQERVDRVKKEHLRNAARYYLREFIEEPPAGYQFDVIAVLLDPQDGKPKLKHFPDAF